MFDNRSRSQLIFYNWSRNPGRSQHIDLESESVPESRVLESVHVSMMLFHPHFYSKTLLNKVARTIGDKRDPVMLQTFQGQSYHLLFNCPIVL